jgi:hypothetical protein
LAAAELLSSGSDSPSGLVPHSGNIHGLHLVLALPDFYGWLLGQEGEVSDCSDAGTDFLLVGRSDCTSAASAERTASDTAAGADANADAGAGDLA